MPAESNEVPKEATPEVKPEVVAARPLVFLDIEVIISNLHFRLHCKIANHTKRSRLLFLQNSCCLF